MFPKSPEQNCEGDDELPDLGWVPFIVEVIWYLTKIRWSTESIGWWFHMLSSAFIWLVIPVFFSDGFKLPAGDGSLETSKDILEILVEIWTFEIEETVSSIQRCVFLANFGLSCLWRSQMISKEAQNELLQTFVEDAREKMSQDKCVNPKKTSQKSFWITP